MSMKINFDLAHNPESPTFVLATKSGRKIGQLRAYNIVIKDSLKEASEFSFKVNKYNYDTKTNKYIEDSIWEDIVDFKLVWCKNYDMWYQITVEVEESDETVKNVSGIKLAKAELSQIMLYDIEINTETDISREDYELPTILMDEVRPERSLLHRIMEKAPHYKFVHVDNTLAKIQRTFQFDDISIDDAFTEIEEEIGCIFVTPCNSDINGNINRTIYVYDIQNLCSDCGYRGDFTGVCPECGSSNIREGYGEDTTIFVSAEELAEDIQFVTDSDSVKNCFKLEGGDDLMTATIKNCNPNGSDYIWYISDEIKKDMSSELVSKIESYDEQYKYYQESYSYNVPSSSISNYNNLVTKYKNYNKDLETVSSPIVGFPKLMNAYYNTIDMILFLRSELMPPINVEEITAKMQADRVSVSNIGSVGVSNLNNASQATADNLVLSAVRSVTDSRYQVKINNSSMNNNIWTGSFTFTNYSNKEDTATSRSVSINLTDDYSSIINQKLRKSLANGNDDKDIDNYSINQLFGMTLESFKIELKKYCLKRLISFHDACQSCLDILIEQGVSDKSAWQNETPNLYNEIYVPYYNKLNAIESETKVRESEISTVENGLQADVENKKIEIQKALDFEKYLGETLLHEFVAYRRDDKFSNDNYISDGLDNTEIFERALEFISVAKNEIYKSAVLQHSIACSLRNLLAIKKFEPIVDYFEVGNWIRVMVDDTVYKLRLLSYEIDFDNLENISVEFSDVTKTAFGYSDQQSLIEKTTSIASSYNYTQRQATKGSSANNILSMWFQDGLDATHTKIIGGADNQTQTWDNHGMLFRRYNSITDDYDDVQLKIINSTIAITDDNWKSTRTAIGQFYYHNPTTNKVSLAYGINGELIVGSMIVGEKLGLYNSSATLSFDENGLKINNDKNTFELNPNSNTLIKISDTEQDLLYFDNYGNLNVVGAINAKTLTAGGKTSSSASVNGLFIDNNGNLYSGNSNQTIIRSDGSFQFGGANGLTYDGSNKVHLGDNVELTWDGVVDVNIPDDVLREGDVVNVNILPNNDILGWTVQNISTLSITYDKDTEYYTITNSSGGTYGAYTSVEIEPNTKYTLSFEVKDRAGLRYTLSSTKQNLTTSSTDSLYTSSEKKSFTFTSGSSDKYINLFAYCQGTSSSNIRKIKLEKGSVATGYASTNVSSGLVTKITKDTIETATIRCNQLESGGTITGVVIEGNTIRGNTIDGENITGSTISGGTISGTTITGGTITGSSITVGTTNQTKVNSDGTFQLGGSNGISYDGNGNIVLGSNVKLSWSSIQDADSHIPEGTDMSGYVRENILENSDLLTWTKPTSATVVEYDSVNEYYKIYNPSASDTNTSWYGIRQNLILKPNTTYTLSFTSCNGYAAVTARLYTTETNSGSTGIVTYTQDGKHEVTLKTNSNNIYLGLYVGAQGNKVCCIKEIKLEEGSGSTGWVATGNQSSLVTSISQYEISTSTINCNQLSGGTIRGQEIISTLNDGDGNSELMLKNGALSDGGLMISYSGDSNTYYTGFKERGGRILVAVCDSLEDTKKMAMNIYKDRQLSGMSIDGNRIYATNRTDGDIFSIILGHSEKMPVRINIGTDINLSKHRINNCSNLNCETINNVSISDYALTSDIAKTLYSTGKDLPSTNLNNVKTSGIYAMPSSGLTNSPLSSVGGTLIVMVVGTTGNIIRQIVHPAGSTGNIYIRNISGSTYNDWYKIEGTKV